MTTDSCCRALFSLSVFRLVTVSYLTHICQRQTAVATYEPLSWPCQEQRWASIPLISLSHHQRAIIFWLKKPTLPLPTEQSSSSAGQTEPLPRPSCLAWATLMLSYDTSLVLSHLNEPLFSSAIPFFLSWKKKASLCLSTILNRGFVG